MKPTPYDHLIPKAGLRPAYWWLESGGNLYLRRQWSCIGIVTPNAEWRLQAWPPLQTRTAATRRQAAWFLARVVAVLGEDGGLALAATQKRLAAKLVFTEGPATCHPARGDSPAHPNPTCNLARSLRT